MDGLGDNYGDRKVKFSRNLLDILTILCQYQNSSKEMRALLPEPVSLEGHR